MNMNMNMKVMESAPLALNGGDAAAMKTLLSRTDFPPEFSFGCATAAYQVEGAALEDGRGPCIWDTFTKIPGKIKDGGMGDFSVDQYHRFEEDVDLLAKLGFDAYRFSISWSRILPDGTGSTVNQQGIAYYNCLINSLLERGIKPFATLYHWDLPQHLEDAFGGWLGLEIVKHFAKFAEICFEAFGDRVKHWITLNEPLRFSIFGYCVGLHAPGRTSNRARSHVGDSSVEPYICSHHALLAHAAAANIYNRKYKLRQGGVIGLTLDSEWAEPLTSSAEDMAAAQRHLEYHLGWFLDPIYFGDYPDSMKSKIGDRLPGFTSDEKVLLKGSSDFIGINHYTTRYITSAFPNSQNKVLPGWPQDIGTERLVELDGTPIGDKGASAWMYIVPWGFKKLILWVSQRYNRPPIYVTENGMDDEDNTLMPIEHFLHDYKRVKFYQDYLLSLATAIREGADVRGYFAWSMLDNFEWENGYTKRFGIVYVDYKDHMRRHPKDSAIWFSEFLKSDAVRNSNEPDVLSMPEQFQVNGSEDAHFGSLVKNDSPWTQEQTAAAFA